MGWGLQGECDSITVWHVETYFRYLDLEISVDGETKTIRAYTSKSAPFEAGDLALKDGDTLSWYDEDAEALVASTSTRPTNVAKADLAKTIPWYDENGTIEVVMMDFRFNVDRTDYSVTPSTGHVNIDIDFANSGLAISDTSSDEKIMETISLPFLETDPSTSNALLTATLTISEDRPADFETPDGEGS